MSSVPKHPLDLTTSLAGHRSPLLFSLLSLGGKEPSVAMQVHLLHSQQLALKCLF